MINLFRPLQNPVKNLVRRRLPGVLPQHLNNFALAARKSGDANTVIDTIAQSTVAYDFSQGYGFVNSDGSGGNSTVGGSVGFVQPIVGTALATQATTANKPVQLSNGIYCDGVNDVLNFAVTNATYKFILISKNNNDANSGNPIGGDGFLLTQLIQHSTSNTLIVRATSILVNLISFTSGATIPAPYTATSSLIVTGTGNANAANFSIGRRQSGVNPFEGNIYGAYLFPSGVNIPTSLSKFFDSYYNLGLNL